MLDRGYACHEDVDVQTLYPRARIVLEIELFAIEHNGAYIIKVTDGNKILCADRAVQQIR